MSTPFEKRIIDFTKRLEDENAFKVIDELITYLQGMSDNENNPIRQEQINGLMISVILLKGLSAVATEVGKQKDEMKSQLNSHLERIIKLEKRFDGLDAGK
jgi:hypothetical protein